MTPIYVNGVAYNSMFLNGVKYNRCMVDGKDYFGGKPKEDGLILYFEDIIDVEVPIDEMDFNHICIIDWGDGSSSELTRKNYGTARYHKYTIVGNYKITLKGSYLFFGFGMLPRSKNDLKSVEGSFCSAVRSFASAFHDCVNLQSIPSGLFPNNNNEHESFFGTFTRCAGLTSIPSGLFANNPNVTIFYQTFSRCTGLTSIPSDLFDNTPNVTSFTMTFILCTGLTSIPSDLFDNIPNVTDFWMAFNGCINLEGNAPTLWLRTNPVAKGGMCFYKCTKLSNYAEIPSSWK